MTGYLLPLLTGFALGFMLRWAGLHHPEGLRSVLGLRRSAALRSALYALGLTSALTALLMWLAVIDVDEVTVLPLSGGALLGGVVFGAAAALCGFTPTTAAAGLGGGPAPQALCAMAGMLVATPLLPLLSGVTEPLVTLPPMISATLFRVTLDEPFLLDGGFLGQGCLGLLLMTLAVCIPSPRTVKAAAPDAPAPAPAGETVVATLPGEEPLVLDVPAAPDDELTLLDALEDETEDVGRAEGAEGPTGTEESAPDAPTDAGPMAGESAPPDAEPPEQPCAAAKPAHAATESVSVSRADIQSEEDGSPAPAEPAEHASPPDAEPPEQPGAAAEPAHTAMESVSVSRAESQPEKDGSPAPAEPAEHASLPDAEPAEQPEADSTPAPAITEASPSPGMASRPAGSRRRANPYSPHKSKRRKKRR